MGGFGEPQAAPEDRHEEDPTERVAFRPHREKSFDLLGAQNGRGLDHSLRSLDADEVGFDVQSEHPVVEGPQRVDRQVDRGRGELAFGDEVQYPRADLGLSELIRGTMMK